MKLAAAAATALITLAATHAQAVPIQEGVYKLTNVVQGVQPTDVGGFHELVDESWVTYDFENNGAGMLLTYDAGLGAVTIAGSAYNLVENRLVDIDLTYTGMIQVADDQIHTATMDTVGVFDGFDVMAKPNPNGNERTFVVRTTDLTGETLRGFGWLSTATAYFGDFQFAGERIADLPTDPGDGGSVPAPGGLALMLIGAASLYRRRKQG